MINDDDKNHGLNLPEKPQSRKDLILIILLSEHKVDITVVLINVLWFCIYVKDFI